VSGPGPLDGIRVLDLTRVLSGPHCTRMLADLGAEVIKVEPPIGDLTRFAYPRINSISSYFTQQNCGKWNVSLDMKQPEALGLLQRLAAECDVVVENFRPGVTKRMGLDYETLSAGHPRLVYASISGYGQTGPWQRRRAYASVVQAESGYIEMEGQSSGIRRNNVMSHADVYTSLECLTGLLAALFQRERTGTGQWVEISMAETMLCVNDHTHWEMTGRQPEPGAIPNFGPGDYPVLELASGRRVVVAGHPAEPGTFETLVELMDRPDLLADPLLADRRTRYAHMDVVIDALGAWAATLDDEAEVEELLAAKGIAMGVVRTVQELAESEWADERGAIVAVDDRGGGTVSIPNSPWHFSDAVTGVRGRPAYRGEDNREVFGRLLGFDDGALDRLESDGVLTSRVPTG
jgi:crotonobetainyl-CoA:carnitine CoA-transferase CaiB-like acyl-CoA transferase